MKNNTKEILKELDEAGSKDVADLIRSLHKIAEEMYGWLNNHPPTSIGHTGFCGPNSNCDYDCMEHAAYCEDLHNWRKVLYAKD